MNRFGDVVRASRNTVPGLGVIAIATVAGTVEDSAAEIVRKRPSALPPIVGRVDIPVKLSLIGSEPQTIEKLSRRGVRCFVQKPAYEQCKDYLNENLPWLRVQFDGESTQAVKKIVAKNRPDWIAIGPSFAAEPLGGVILGPDQINPQGSVTSFYALQRDPREEILPVDPTKTESITVVSLAHPEGEGEFDKCMELADKLGVGISRFIQFNKGDFTKHNSGLLREGGILEIEGDIYDEHVTEFCARINGLRGNDGVDGPFDTIKLGCYPWYPNQD
jgi:prephenate dehydratase